jgi:hypothetical protein
MVKLQVWVITQKPLIISKIWHGLKKQPKNVITISFIYNKFYKILKLCKYFFFKYDTINSNHFSHTAFVKKNLFSTKNKKLCHIWKKNIYRVLIFCRIYCKWMKLW